MRELSPEDIRWCYNEARRELGLNPAPPPGWVEITHPTSNGEPAVVTEEAFKQVWKKQGWSIVLRPD